MASAFDDRVSHAGAASARGDQGSDVPPPSTRPSKSQSTVSGLKTLPVSETFTSRQGEGSLTGVNSFFVRTSGCNLRCHFCDTPYTSWAPESVPRSVPGLIDEARQSGTRYVVVTGGEPTIHPATKELIERLCEQDFHVTLETAGSFNQVISCDLLSLSPKLAASAPSADEHPTWNKRHDRRRQSYRVMRRMMAAAKQTQLKFVINDPDQASEIASVVNELEADAEDVWLMPEGVTTMEIRKIGIWLRPLCVELGYRFCDRMHIHWYGNVRGT